MRFISSIFDINIAEWEELIKISINESWFQTAQAYEFYASLPELFQPFVYALAETEMDKSYLKACVVGYITKEKNSVKQHFTKRAIINGGPIFLDNISEDNLSFFLTSVAKDLSSKAIYIETRNFNDYSKWKKVFDASGFKYEPHLNFQVDTSSVEIVESNLGKSRKRDIKTSFRDGATIIENPSFEQLKQYYSILDNLYKTKVKTPLFPFEFFEKLWKHKDGRFLLVELNGEIIGGTVCVIDKHSVYEWFVCGRDGEWKSIFPSSVATYAGIKYAAEHGCDKFDMMGAGTPDAAYGVRDFKAKFGGKLVEHGRFCYICNPLLYSIGKIGVSIIKKI